MPFNERMFVDTFHVTWLSQSLRFAGSANDIGRLSATIGKGFCLTAGRERTRTPESPPENHYQLAPSLQLSKITSPPRD